MLISWKRCAECLTDSATLLSSVKGMQNLDEP